VKIVKNKWTWIIGGLVIVAVIAFFALRSGGVLGQSEELQTGDVAPVVRGDLSASATASGRVKARREATLALSAPGKVQQVLVDVGDTVQAEDALVRLETGTLERAGESARQVLAIKQAELAELTKPASTLDIKAARAAVTSAKLTLDDLLDGPDKDEIAAAEAIVDAAQAGVWEASEQVDQVLAGPDEAAIVAARANLIAAVGQQQDLKETHDDIIDACFKLPNGEEFCPLYGPVEEKARAGLEVATAAEAAAQEQLDALLDGPDQDLVGAARAGVGVAAARRDAAQARLDLLLTGPTDAQIAGAELQLVQAEAVLDQLMTGATEEQVAIAEAVVEQARIGLAVAEKNLAEATMTAPFSGVVTAVYVNEGELATGPAIELVDMDSMEVVLDVDEVDFGMLALGQPAIVTLEAWPNDEIESEIVLIAHSNTPDPRSALVSYQVHLALDQTDLPLRVNMTANADLITAQRDDVLLIPNRALTVDRAENKYYVNLVQIGPDGEISTTQTEVTAGLRDRRNTQITGGLSEGDQVLIGDTAPRLDIQEEIRKSRGVE